MIHTKTPSPSYKRQSKKRHTSSGRTVVDSAQTIQLDGRANPKAPVDVPETEVLGFFEALEEERIQAERAKLLEEKKFYPIAPDALIPNSTIRSMFKIKEIEPIDMQLFRLRLISSIISNPIQTGSDERLKRFAVLINFDGIHSTIFQLLNKIDILDNLENKTNKNLNWQNDDDEWVELGDPDVAVVGTTTKPTTPKKLRSIRPTADTSTARQQEPLSDVFKRMRREVWWKPTDENANNNPRSMLLYLLEILKAKQKASYEPACNYIVEIFKTYGIEPSLVNQILDILINHLAQSIDDPLDIHTVRTIAQFMIERKNIVVPLLDFALKYQPENTLRQETVNAIKFITDVSNSDDMDLVFDNMPTVRNAADDTFSLKTIIERIKNKQKKAAVVSVNEEGEEIVEDNIHPFLKKISEERWFPRGDVPITLDAIIDAILAKLPNATKTMFKTLTTHLVQLHRVIGYSKEQFARVSNGIISVLSHDDADYRLRAATVLAELGEETKAIDIALLTSFLNDPRILVRTECCDTLKKLTGIMSDTVLKDCAEDIPYLKTLAEESFTLQNYLKRKKRVIKDEHVLKPVDENQGETNVDIEKEQNEEDKTIPIDEDDQEKSRVDIDESTYPLVLEDKTDDVIQFVRSRSPSPETDERIYTKYNLKPLPDSSTPLEHPPIRVEINDRRKPTVHPPTHVPKPRRELPLPTQSVRSRRPLVTPHEQHNRVPIKVATSDQLSNGRLLPNNTNMWDSYTKQNENDEDDRSHVRINPDQPTDPIQTIIDDHTRQNGYYRMIPKRLVLVPHIISFGDIFGDQSHITLDKKPSVQLTSSTMQLSDYNRNKRHLNEVEFVQLLSSLIIRGVQIHRKRERFIPGPFSSNARSLDSFTDALTISQMQLHSLVDPHQTSSSTSFKLPHIPPRRRSASEMARIKTDAHVKAAKEGIDLRKAQDMEDALSNLLQTDREHRRSRFHPEPTSHPPVIPITFDQTEVTHAWLLEQLLTSRGIPDAHKYIQQISRAYPKFYPLLHSRVPNELIPIIWNDPMMKQLVSIITARHEELSGAEISMKPNRKKLSIPAFDDEHSSNFFDYSAPGHLLAMQQQHREDHKKKVLPAIHGTKLRLPRHVLKFGFRDIDLDSPEASLDTLRDENTSRIRRRRIYMHLRMSVNEDTCTRHELTKNQLRQMLKTDY